MQVQAVIWNGLGSKRMAMDIERFEVHLVSLDPTRGGDQENAPVPSRLTG
jgi:hypothetical protein